jgi:hypothetical protein
LILVVRDRRLLSVLTYGIARFIDEPVRRHWKARSTTGSPAMPSRFEAGWRLRRRDALSHPMVSFRSEEVSCLQHVWTYESPYTGLTKLAAPTRHSSSGRRSQMTHKGIMESVKDKVVGSIKGTGRS